MKPGVSKVVLPILPIMAAVVFSLVLSGCGRRSPPELPASAYMQNDKGQQVKKPKSDKPFILDKLIQ